MSSGKGGQQTTSIKLPESIEKAAKENQAYAKKVSELPYAPNFGLQYAAFTPMQEASFGNTNSAASAFGLPTGGMGMPAAQNVGGFSGYSTKPLYQNAMSQVDPAIMALYQSLFPTNRGQQVPQGLPKQGSGGFGGLSFGGGGYSQPIAFK